MEYKSGSFPGAINTGIRYANASRVGLLLADGWFKEEAIAECLGHDADIRIERQHRSFRRRADQRGSISNAVIDSLSFTCDAARSRLPPSFFLFRKKALLDAGYLDESIRKLSRR
jgi:hypothetical protein